MDGRELLDPEIADEVGDPSAAFDALRAAVEAQGRAIGAEITVMGKGVEALFDQFDRLRTLIDLGADRSRIEEQLEVLARNVHGIETSPLMHRGAEYYASALERAGRDVFQKTVRELEQPTAELKQIARALAGQLESARERQRQDRRMMQFTVIGMLLGLLVGMLSLMVLPRLIGLGLDEGIAARVLGTDRWHAGIILMRSGDPTRWNQLAEVDKLQRANRQAITACTAAAAKARQDQSCTITVAAP